MSPAFSLRGGRIHRGTGGRGAAILPVVFFLRPSTCCSGGFFSAPLYKQHVIPFAPMGRGTLRRGTKLHRARQKLQHHPFFRGPGLGVMRKSETLDAFTNYRLLEVARLVLQRREMWRAFSILVDHRRLVFGLRRPIHRHAQSRHRGSARFDAVGWRPAFVRYYPRPIFDSNFSRARHSRANSLSGPWRSRNWIRNGDGINFGVAAPLTLDRGTILGPTISSICTRLKLLGTEISS